MDWGPGPAKGGQKKQKHPHLWQSPQIIPSRKRKNFFSISTRRLAESVEGLNSPLALAAVDLWPKKCGPMYWPARSLKGMTFSAVNVYSPNAAIRNSELS